MGKGVINNRMNNLSYYVVHAFIIFTIYNYIRFGMVDVYPQMETSVIYGMNANFDKRVTNTYYCNTPSTCIVGMCELYNLDGDIGHVVIDFLSSDVDMSVCYPSYLTLIMSSDIIFQCMIVFIIYLSLLFTRMILYNCCSCKSIIFIMFFIEKIMLFSIMFLLPYIETSSYIIFILLSSGFSALELFNIFDNNLEIL